MAETLEGRRVAIIAANGFEESELTSPRKAIEDAGGQADVISSKTGEIQAFRHLERGDTIKVDKSIDSVDANDYDALVIPGGLFSPDAMRTDKRFISFVRDFFDQRKPVAAICHGPQVLISADVVKGRTMTAIEAVRKDLENAGAQVKDDQVVVDNGLVTSRSPDDLDAFNAKIVEEIGEGRHGAQHA